MKNTSFFPKILLGLYVILFAVLAFNPIDRMTWWSENITVWIIVGALIILYKRGVQFSNLAYALMSVLIYMHTIGGHWTFSEVPFGWVTETFGFERNNFDRIAHFSVGFYAYGFAEWLAARGLVRSKFLLFTYPVFVIAAIAGLYEVIEWIYASNAAPGAGAAYLGSQGDEWDAQKDILADTLGAILATLAFFMMQGAKKIAAAVKK